MHPYHIEGSGKIAVAITCVSILLAWLLHAVLNAVDFETQWWLSVPSVAGFYSSLYWLFDRYVWKFGILRKLELIQLPDLNGKWSGYVESSYRQGDRTYPVSVDILQRWSKILVRLDTEYSRSRSIIGNLISVDLVNPELSYQYISDPKSNAPCTMEMHRGTAVLELIGENLEGYYYTGRGRREVGVVKLCRV